MMQPGVGRTSDRQEQKRAKAANEITVEQAKQVFTPSAKQQENTNNDILSAALHVSQNMSEQPGIIRQAAAKQRLMDGLSSLNTQLGRLTCAVQMCPNNLAFATVEELVAHHNSDHPGKVWAVAKCTKLNTISCGKCKLMFMKNSSTCAHIVRSTAEGVDIVTAMSIYPLEHWSITIAALHTDIPASCLSDYDKFLDTVKCKVAIASYEHGDKENNLHLQSAADIFWNKEDGKGMAKFLREELKVIRRIFLYNIYTLLH
jgi:hypothetical protein